MIDQAIALPRERVGAVFGRLDPDIMKHAARSCRASGGQSSQTLLWRAA
jgi:hypothetical protein